MMYRLSNRDRRGHSLIELMVTMSATVVVLTLSVTCLHRMMSIRSQSSRFLDAEQTALRLSRQLRHDALLAPSANVVTQPGEDEEIVVLFAASEGSGVDVEYRLTPARATRISATPSGEATREDYSLPAGTRWHAAWDESRQRLTLLANNPPAQSEPSEHSPPPAWQVPFEMQLVASVGRIERASDSLPGERDGGSTE